MVTIAPNSEIEIHGFLRKKRRNCGREKVLACPETAIGRTKLKEIFLVVYKIRNFPFMTQPCQRGSFLLTYRLEVCEYTH